MYKKIKIEGNSADVYTKIISQVKFGITNDTEIFVMQSLVKNSTNMSLTTTKDVNAYIAKEVGITTNLLSTCIHRLEKKEAIRRMGKTILINLAYKDLDLIKGVVFSVQAPHS